MRTDLTTTTELVVQAYQFIQCYLVSLFWEPTEMPTLLLYFEKYFPDDHFEKGSEFTNRYYIARKGRKLNTSPQEIKQFYGVHLSMGCMKYPRIPMYWQASTRVPVTADVMARDR